jgi:type II secretory pathway pseudopilin PulG
VVKNTSCKGFVYLTALFAIAVIGISVSAYAVNWSHEAQREREQELLFIGAQFRKAIADYYEQSPGAVKRYPGKLDDLMFDSRYLTMKRHLRTIYADPMTGTKNWGIVQAPDGGVLGVYSLSDKTPIKIAGFDADEAEFANAKRYSDWRFTYVPPAVPVGSGPQGAVQR